MLPSVDFCGLNVTRLVLGANPFGGFSHQSPERDQQMREYYTPEKIVETWEIARDGGINTMITNNGTPHVLEAVRLHLASKNPLQWIAQVANRSTGTMNEAIDRAIDSGCSALYFHGALVDRAFSENDEGTVRSWTEYTRSKNIPVGVAGHAPEAHLWGDALDVVDFHAVCCFNCGSLHEGKGSKFRLQDIGAAMQAIRQIRKPCIAYKIMGAGRIDARMAFEYAFESIKPTDVVNVGMHRGDIDDMVALNIGLVREILG